MPVSGNKLDCQQNSISSRYIQFDVSSIENVLCPIQFFPYSSRFLSSFSWFFLTEHRIVAHTCAPSFFRRILLLDTYSYNFVWIEAWKGPWSTTARVWWDSLCTHITVSRSIGTRANVAGKMLLLFPPFSRERLYFGAELYLHYGQ